MGRIRAAAGENRIESVLVELASAGPVTGKMRQSLEMALSPVPEREDIVGVYRCGILSGATEREGIAILTPERLSVFDRRGFRSLDQQLHLPLTLPFTIQAGPEPAHVRITVDEATPVTLDLLDPAPAVEFREQVEHERPVLEQGWWARASVRWPGSLGSDPSWSYLGGDMRMPRPVVGVRLHVGAAGFILTGSDGATGHLAGWSNVRFVHVVGPAEARRRARARGLLDSEAFGPGWAAPGRRAFLVLGYDTGEEVFLATDTQTEADLRASLLPVAEVMPVHAGAGESG